MEKEDQVKKCSVCGEVKPLSEFYRISASRGRRPDCKVCRRAYQREYNKRPEASKRIRTYWLEYIERPQTQTRLRDYYRDYNRKPEVKKRKGEYARIWATEEKRKAYRWTAEAVRHGEMEPASAFLCVDCGKQARQYFYESYAIPPKLIPVCVSCHRIRVSAKSKEE